MRRKMETLIKPIVEFEGYKVTNKGDVIGKTGKTLKSWKTNAGYQQVCLKKYDKKFNRTIHRLVAEAFLCPQPDRKQCNHKDGIKINNNVENLEWVTCSENHSHAFAIGLRSHTGEDHNNSKLKNGEVWLIKKLIKSKKLYHREIAEMFGVNRRTISGIKIGQRWSHIAL